MKFRYKSLLLLLFIIFVASIFLGISYHFYKRVIANKSIVVVDGDITINYLNGKRINQKQNKYEFSVTNNSSKDIYYYIKFIKVNNTNIDYSLICNDNNINIQNKLKDGIVSSYIIINGDTTQNYELIFNNINKSEFSAVIQIGIESSEEKSDIFAESILKNNKIVEKKTAFNEPALEDEGLIKTTDDNGISYYFRGAVLNNNVLFANMNWKIVRINGDGSIKIVLNNILDAVSVYNEGTDYSYSSSQIKNTLNDWYKIYLEKYSDYIANYKFCNDVLIEDNNAYAAYNRIFLNNIPNNNCLGTKVSSKIGLLTIDEVVMAGASQNENKSFYLYNTDITSSYYTISGAKYSQETYYPFMVNQNGAIEINTIGSSANGVRPVINIIKNVKVNGDGTIDNPYILAINEK